VPKLTTTASLFWIHKAMPINNTKVVSYRFLYWAMSTIMRDDDVDDGDVPELEFPGMDSSNPVEVKERVIRPFVLPWVHSLDDVTQRMMKDSFRYYLNAQITDRYGRELFQDMFNSIIPAFEGPKPISLFFAWIWDELYGPEDYRTDDLSNYIVDDDTPYQTQIRTDQSW
jgi:hypothetical protein